MPIIDFTKPLIIVFALIIYTVLMYISYKRRKSIVIAFNAFYIFNDSYISFGRLYFTKTRYSRWN